MNEKRSSVVGFALIGIIMLVFTWYNTKQVEKRQQEAMVRDSLATAAALERGELQEPAAAAADTAAVDAEAIPDEEAYRHAYLQEASRAETEYFTLENDKLRVRISSLGAQPYEVQVKDYYTYDSSDLILIRPDKSLFDLEMNTDQWLNTSDLHFRLAESTDSTISWGWTRCSTAAPAS